MNLTELGWNPAFASKFQSYQQRQLMPARVARVEREAYVVYSEAGELDAEVTGKFRHEAASPADFPAVGDWVAAQPLPGEAKATIHAVLPRTSKFARKVAGEKTVEQIVAANVDTLFLVCGLDGDFNVARIERYLVPAWDSGAAPVIVLNKADVCDDTGQLAAEVEAVSCGVPVHIVSALKRNGLDELRPYLVAGKTIALVGSSGVGKSTLINALLGEDRLDTGQTSEWKGRGRHTTTWRELILLPTGGLLVDNPGMRELQLWSDDGHTLDATFADIEALAAQCKFRDCRHENEPGCAVQQALRDGSLPGERYKRYRKLQRELRYLAMQQDDRLRREEHTKWKRIAKAQRARTKLLRQLHG